MQLKHSASRAPCAPGAGDLGRSPGVGRRQSDSSRVMDASATARGGAEGEEGKEGCERVRMESVGEGEGGLGGDSVAGAVAEAAMVKDQEESSEVP